MSYSATVNQTFIVAIKTMVHLIGFYNGEAREFVSNIYVLADLTLRITTPSVPYLSFNKIQLRSHNVVFYFSSTCVRNHRRR